jgi:hypothetical protein
VLVLCYLINRYCYGQSGLVTSLLAGTGLPTLISNVELHMLRKKEKDVTGMIEPAFEKKPVFKDGSGVSDTLVAQPVERSFQREVINVLKQSYTGIAMGGSANDVVIIEVERWTHKTSGTDGRIDLLIYRPHDQPNNNIGTPHIASS